MGKSELQQACEDRGITITSKHLGLEWDEDPKFPRDKWSCTIHYQDRSATFDFFTGIGHRVVAFGWKAEGPNKWGSSGGQVVFGLREALDKGVLTFKRTKNPETKRNEVLGPEVADVLRCVLDDWRACETTFDDWCSDLGFDNDSLKALNTYLASQRNGSKVVKLLGYELAKELVDKEH